MLILVFVGDREYRVGAERRPRFLTRRLMTLLLMRSSDRSRYPKDGNESFTCALTMKNERAESRFLEKVRLEDK